MSTQRCFSQIRWAIGLAGWGFIYAAILAVAWEAFTSIKSARYVMVTAGEQWHQVHGASLAAYQEFVATRVPSLIAGPMSDLLLAWPAWAVYGGAGFVLLGLGRMRRESADNGGRGKRAAEDLGWQGSSFH